MSDNVVQFPDVGIYAYEGVNVVVPILRHVCNERGEAAAMRVAEEMVLAAVGVVGHVRGADHARLLLELAGETL
jgi:hypothetical protein